MGDWTGHNPRSWRECAEHGRYDAQDGGCPDCADEDDEEYRSCWSDDEDDDESEEDAHGR